MSSHSLRVLFGALFAVALLTVSACGADEGGTTDGGTGQESPATSTPGETTDPTPSDEPAPETEQAQTVAVTFADGDVEPVAKVVELGVGEKLVLEIRAEEAGELHVHSTPEQEIAYPAGDSTSEIVIDRPGVVEVESHELHKLVLQLEVR